MSSSGFHINSLGFFFVFKLDFLNLSQLNFRGHSSKESGFTKGYTVSRHGSPSPVCFAEVYQQRYRNWVWSLWSFLFSSKGKEQKRLPPSNYTASWLVQAFPVKHVAHWMWYAWKTSLSTRANRQESPEQHKGCDLLSHQYVGKGIVHSAETVTPVCLGPHSQKPYWHQTLIFPGVIC